ncbi:nucleotidyltransferase domain-containing protein [Pseudomonas sp. AL-54]|nr:nucleotidyltransferase domain-containing protein [Pseudomonas lopnurensis]
MNCGRPNREAINTLGKQYGARRIRVFGSAARGEKRPDSDIDFLVDFEQGYDLFAQRLPLAEGLAKLCERNISPVPEHELNRYLRDSVIDEAVEL